MLALPVNHMDEVPRSIPHKLPWLSLCPPDLKQDGEHQLARHLDSSIPPLTQFPRPLSLLLSSGSGLLRLGSLELLLLLALEDLRLANVLAAQLDLEHALEQLEVFCAGERRAGFVSADVVGENAGLLAQVLLRALGLHGLARRLDRLGKFRGDLLGLHDVGCLVELLLALAFGIALGLWEGTVLVWRELQKKNALGAGNGREVGDEGLRVGAYGVANRELLLSCAVVERTTTTAAAAGLASDLRDRLPVIHFDGRVWFCVGLV